MVRPTTKRFDDQLSRFQMCFVVVVVIVLCNLMKLKKLSWKVALMFFVSIKFKIKGKSNANICCLLIHNLTTQIMKYITALVFFVVAALKTEILFYGKVFERI